MKRNRQSFYTLLAISLFVATTITIIVQIWYDYNDVKHKMTNDIKVTAQISLKQIQKTIAPYIHAFSVDEYMKIIQNEMEHRTIFAVVMEDHNLGKVLGEKSFVSGKIRDKNWNIVDLDPENKGQMAQLRSQYYKASQVIFDQNHEILAKIDIYSTDKFIYSRLQHVITREVFISLIVYIVYLIILYFSIHYLFLRSISKIINDLDKTDKYHIPMKIKVDETTSEIFTLTTSLSKMIQTIKESRKIQSDQKKELQMIFDYSKDGIFIMDLESNFLTFNNAYLHMIGFTKEELLATSCLELTLANQRELAIQAIKEVIERGQIENFEKICMTKNGKQININMSMVLLPDKKRILATVKDMTHLKLLESQSKLAAMGEMIGNIAHQWRQPLTVISTGASGAKVKKKMGVLEDDDFDRTMDLIVDQTQYLSQTIDDFRDFIKNKENPKTYFSIVDTINKVFSLIDASLTNNYITVIKELKDDCEIEGFQNELIQAFINVINNAKDILKSKVSNEQERYIKVSTYLSNNELIIKIQDNGGGIPEAILNRVFEPYFTTKHQSVGTGIGLYMTRDIIINHHEGEIEASNDSFEYKGKTFTGACFIIKLKKV